MGVKDLKRVVVQRISNKIIKFTTTDKGRNYDDVAINHEMRKGSKNVAFNDGAELLPAGSNGVAFGTVAVIDELLVWGRAQDFSSKKEDEKGSEGITYQEAYKRFWTRMTDRFNESKNEEDSHALRLYIWTADRLKWKPAEKGEEVDSRDASSDKEPYTDKENAHFAVSQNGEPCFVVNGKEAKIEFGRLGKTRALWREFAVALTRSLSRHHDLFKTGFKTQLAVIMDFQEKDAYMIRAAQDSEGAWSAHLSTVDATWVGEGEMAAAVWVCRLTNALGVNAPAYAIQVVTTDQDMLALLMVLLIRQTHKDKANKIKHPVPVLYWNSRATKNQRKTKDGDVIPTPTFVVNKLVDEWCRSEEDNEYAFIGLCCMLGNDFVKKHELTKGVGTSKLGNETGKPKPYGTIRTAIESRITGKEDKKNPVDSFKHKKHKAIKEAASAFTKAAIKIGTNNNVGGGLAQRVEFLFRYWITLASNLDIQNAWSAFALQKGY